MPTPSFVITCTYNERIANDIYEFHFTKPADFAFTAGQFILFDVAAKDNPSDIQTRAFSIASAPREDKLIFLIKLVPNGRASHWVSDVLKPGGTVRIQGPLGNFTLRESNPKDYLFICTSSGNVPFRSQLLTILGSEGRRIDMVFGCRGEEDLFWVDLFEDMAREHPNFHFHVTLSRPGDAWKGHRGRVQTIVPAIINDFSRVQVYVCGSPAMCKEVKKLSLEEWKVPREDFHMEGYI